MSKTPEQELRTKAATDNGLVLVYFPNGTSFRMFESQCRGCRHERDIGGSLAPRLQPPHNICAWGILDRIIHHCYFAGDEDTYNYGGSVHDPLDIDVGTCPPTCLRFTPRNYGFDDRDPPTPDVPGQMMLEESLGVPKSLRVQELAEVTR